MVKSCFSLFLKKNCEDWKIFKGKLGTELFTWNGITAGVSQYQLEVLSSKQVYGSFADPAI